MRIEDVIREKKWNKKCDLKFRDIEREYEVSGTCKVLGGVFAFFGHEVTIICTECSDMCILIDALNQIERVEVVEIKPKDRT